METIGTTMPRVESEAENIDSKEEFSTIEEDPFQEGNSTYGSPDSSFEISDGVEQIKDVADEKYSVDTQQTLKQTSPDLCIEADETNYDIAIEKHIIAIRKTPEQTTPIIVLPMQSNDSISKNLWVAFCSKCGLKFRHKLGYLLHKQLLHSDLPYELRAEFKKKIHKYSNILVHVPVICKMCRLRFKYQKGLSDHLKLIHNVQPEHIGVFLLEEKQNTLAGSNQIVSIEKRLQPSVVSEVEAVLREYKEKAVAIVEQGVCTKCNRQCKRRNAPNGYTFHMRIKHGKLTKNNEVKPKCAKYVTYRACEYCKKGSRKTSDQAAHRNEK